ncbi:MAG: type IV toxin-antitoxin system AbiEi family antitoxin domain-containing protein [Planctomycetia bacterium]|nr:type IV toxin-antitoxin system AbiEi family antitoxin domain-containing protein [Planctomycetia bacterium]
MKTDSKLKEIFALNGGILKTADLHKANYYYNDIKRLMEQGTIEKIRYGYYLWVSDEEYPSEIQMIQKLFPDVILCMNTALFHYGYIDRVPTEWHLSVDKDSTKSRFRIEYPAVKPYYIALNYLKVGLTNDLMDGVRVRIYNKERLICDCLKRHTRMDRELFNKALQAYIRDPGKDIARLMKYAKIFRLEKTVRNMIGVWL